MIPSMFFFSFSMQEIPSSVCWILDRIVCTKQNEMLQINNLQLQHGIFQHFYNHWK